VAEWKFEVEQDKMIVASGTAPDRDTAMREANHYAIMLIRLTHTGTRC
jgi:hypothetical protein